MSPRGSLQQPLQALVDGVLWLSLEELGQQADLDPSLTLLTLLVRPEAEAQAPFAPVRGRLPALLTCFWLVLPRSPRLETSRSTPMSTATAQRLTAILHR